MYGHMLFSTLASQHQAFGVIYRIYSENKTYFMNTIYKKRFSISLVGLIICICALLKEVKK